MPKTTRKRCKRRCKKYLNKILNDKYDIDDIKFCIMYMDVLLGRYDKKYNSPKSLDDILSKPIKAYELAKIVKKNS